MKYHLDPECQVILMGIFTAQSQLGSPPGYISREVLLDAASLAFHRPVSDLPLLALEECHLIVKAPDWMAYALTETGTALVGMLLALRRDIYS
ncbi:MAG: hypothetical protein WC824_11500 [Bacteroidota bacterium]|jgi:hypothetical protein